MRKPILIVATAAFLAASSAWAASNPPNVEASFGPHPQLPEPQKDLLPTVNTAKAVGWPEGAMPQAAEGLQVAPFATGLQHPRWLYTLPNGDVLVAETDAPPKPEDSKGVKGTVMKMVMKHAGSSHPSANQITLLRDADGDGKAETKTVFLSGLNSPFGMALVGHDLYIANTDSVMRFPYKDGETSITARGKKLTDLPGGLINHHWTKNLIASTDGKYLYASVGSNSNAGDNGIEAEKGRAAIWQIDRATGKTRIFASGLRNPVGMSWNPQSHDLWVAVNERDELGDDLVPDYMTSVKDGGFYGFPYSYYGSHIDDRVKPQRPDLVAKAIAPDYALGAHTASLGLSFYTADLLGDRFKNGAFIGQHGSWNRKPRSGYKVIFVPFKDGQPAGEPQDVLTGFLSDDGDAYGRPVGVTSDKTGALLVADDVGNAVWRVTPGKTQ